VARLLFRRCVLFYADLHRVLFPNWVLGYPLLKPSVLQYPVNDVCNSRCQMCRIWQRQDSNHLSPAELRKVLSSPLFSEVTSVGISGGEPTLRRDLGDLARVLYEALPQLSRVTVITNALNSGQVVERIEEVGRVTRAHSGRLDVMVSLDGVGAVHDRVRGRAGAFRNAGDVMAQLARSEWVDNCRLGCTVVRDNVYHLHELLEFAIEQDMHIVFRPGIPHQRLYARHLIAPFALDFEERYHFAVFLESVVRHYEISHIQKEYYRSLIGQLMYSKPRTSGCDWQHQGVTLSSRGELMYCAVESPVLGSAVDVDAGHLYRMRKADLVDIVNTKCASCRHDYKGRAVGRSWLTSQVRKLKTTAARWAAVTPATQSLWRSASLHRRVLSARTRMRHSVPRTHSGRAQKRDNRCSRVVVCGWYGTETLGDKAILAGVIDAIRSPLGEVEFHLASLEQYISEMTVCQLPEAHDVRVCSIEAARDLARGSDLVVFGGGPIMAIDELAEVSAIFEAAAAAGVPTLVAGCGVGPLGGKLHNGLIARLLGLASFRIYRDENSLLTAAALGVRTAKDIVAEDPSFTWLRHQRQASQFGVDAPGARCGRCLLLGLREWPYEQYARSIEPGKARALGAGYEKEVVAALESLVRAYADLTIIPFPMCTNHLGRDDRWFYRRILRASPRVWQSVDSAYLGRERSPIDAFRVFRGATAALVMRYHALAFAIEAGLPVVSIDYTLGIGKTKSLACSHNVPSVDLRDVTADGLSSRIVDLLVGGRDERICEMKPLAFRQAVCRAIEEMGL